MPDQIIQKPKQPSRREFIKATAVTAAGFMIVPRHVLGGKGFTAPSDKLLVAGIGAGGKGWEDINGTFKTGKANIAFLCDVDDNRAANTVKQFPAAKYYRDWRELFDKEAKNFDAITVSTPDHNHAVTTLAAMQLGKHVYVQKPLTHDVYEARALTDAAKRYKVVTQMGNQGASGDGVRQLHDWFDAGEIGKVHTVYCWSDRPLWPQGIAWPQQSVPVPLGLDWDLWLGTAPFKNYADKIVPFNWRGWWEYGTGALGDMGCHILEAPFRILGLTHVKEVECSAGTVYVDEFKQGYFPESCPPSSHVIMTFPKTKHTKGDLKLHWLDGGLKPERPEELGPSETFGDGPNGMLFIGTRGKMMAGLFGDNCKLLPTSKTAGTKVKQRHPRVPGAIDGHYRNWVEGCLAGYGKTTLSSPFEAAGPLTEALLMANLALRGVDIQRPRANGDGFDYPGRDIKLVWDHQNMKVTNFDEINRFVKREYRTGWV